MSSQQQESEQEDPYFRGENEEGANSNNDEDGDSSSLYSPQTDDDDFPTKTSEAQRSTERLVFSVLSNVDPNLLQTYRDLTRTYVLTALDEGLDANFSSLDASRPWLCYWMCHALNLLGQDLSPTLIQRVITTLSRCQLPSSGGFGGGFMQMAHTAPTYASIMALVSLGSRDALVSIKRGPLYRFLLSLKRADGAFRVHQDGECDTRGMYTVLAVASICNMLTRELVQGCVDWIIRTQGFDGGVGGEPGNESHGGYAYCALASLVILYQHGYYSQQHQQPKPMDADEDEDTNRRTKTMELDAFSKWLYMRQMPIEGGFQGRTNKLVDSCYSFWQGACFALLPMLDPSKFRPNCNATNLLRYVVGACVHGSGGLKDKPGAHRDFYHTCYALSGLSVVLANEQSTSPPNMFGLKQTNPVYNITEQNVGLARAFFNRLSNSHEELMNLSS